ncbi:MAG: hypothetical protein IT449_14040 [Phycisphaerales bacterium]|nr:hypothetical protein [Phycisphaerales bacterium]
MESDHSNTDDRVAGATAVPPPRISRRGQAVRVGIVLLAVAGMLAYAYLPAREFQRRMDCCENLKAYHAGKVSFESLRCPRSGGGYERDIRPAIALPFVHVIAYEPLSNHGGDGGALLFSDGHAEFLMKGSYEARLSDDRRRVEEYMKTHDGLGTPTP